MGGWVLRRHKKVRHTIEVDLTQLNGYHSGATTLGRIGIQNHNTSAEIYLEDIRLL